MKIFVDTAEISEIKDAVSSGLLDGVTTNPSLLKKAVDKRKEKGESVDIEGYIKSMLALCGDRPVSLEVLEGDSDELFRQALVLWDMFHDRGNVVIKIPVNPSLAADDGLSYEGIKTIRRLAERGIPVNTTLIMTPLQGLLAAKAGAAYVSPFAGRIDDMLRSAGKITTDKEAYYPDQGIEGLDDNGIASGIHLVKSTVQIFRNYDIETEVLAASLRNVRQVREAAEAGAHIATIPYSVVRQMLAHPKTLEGMKRFLDDAPEDYRKIFGK